ncbi:uncharacterized protein LOC128965209 [Oppia nitens]|uniref:uncharacterized protein LOC128965209 n=1 Tax=Oppia nitens TaxID=1686743 RepID=UPI0023DC08C1|nr:uncharacterized protein LOC128965209 [Oppia nitens]
MMTNKIIINIVCLLFVLIVSLDTAHIVDDTDDVNDDIIEKRDAMVLAPVASNTLIDPNQVFYNALNQLLEPLMKALGLPGHGLQLVKLVWPVLRFLAMAWDSVLRAITGGGGGGSVTTKATVITTDDGITDDGITDTDVTDDVDLNTSTTDDETN